MRKLLLIAALCAVAGALPATAHAQVPAQSPEPCKLPSQRPLWIDFGTPDLERVFARPGLVVSGSSGEFPKRLRAAGAKTVYWDMYLNRRVGLPWAPADPATVIDRANRLYEYAAAQMECTTPWIILNELFGASVETPWTPTNAQYRANVLSLLRTLTSRGARPFLLVSSTPYAAGEAGEWWRQAAQVTDFVREVFFSARYLNTQGAIGANRHMRVALRRGAAELLAIGVPPSKIGVVLGFQTARGKGGREGLRPSRAWFRVVKWHALAARQVARELRLATIWSWGWGTYNVAGTDPDKPAAACVYLWTRNPRLCNGPAAAGRFNTSRTEGQLILPSGAKCVLGKARIRNAAIARASALTGDRTLALSALYARLVVSRIVRVTPAEVLAAERRLVATQFGGSRAAYRGALARARTTVADARAIIADELRRARVSSRLHVRAPSGREIAAFYSAHPTLLTRRVLADPAPPWLAGRRSGYALAAVAPARVFTTSGRSVVLSMLGRYTVTTLGPPLPLAAVPLPRVRGAIAGALRSFARAERYDRWTIQQQQAAFHDLVCRRDELPDPAAIALRAFLPTVAFR